MPEDAMTTAARKIASLERKIERLNTIQNGYTLADVYGHFMALRHLRGFWPFASVDENGAARDYSMQNRLLASNSVGNEVMANGMVYSPMNGTTQWWSRADEAGLDITGYLTFGGWFWVNDFANNYGLISKDGPSGNRSYLMTTIITTGVIAGAIFPAGTSASAQVVNGSAVAPNTWNFCVVRFSPSAELAIFVNDVKATNTSGIGAGTFNGNMPFNIGGVNGGQLLPGRAALCFLLATSVADAVLSRLFQVSRPFFGV